MSMDQATDLRKLLSSNDAGEVKSSVGPVKSEAIPSERKGRVSFGPSTRARPVRVRTPQLARAIAVASGKGGLSSAVE